MKQFVKIESGAYCVLHFYSDSCWLIYIGKNCDDNQTAG